MQLSKALKYNYKKRENHNELKQCELDQALKYSVVTGAKGLWGNACDCSQLVQSLQLSRVEKLARVFSIRDCMCPWRDGVIPENLGRDVRPASQNPYPIYDVTKIRKSINDLNLILKSCFRPAL